MNDNPMKSMVREFHEAFGVPVNDEPQVAIGKDRMFLRSSLILEEANESIEAMKCVILEFGDKVGETMQAEFKLEEIADGLADLLYVTFGACLEFGIPIEEVFAEVHRSNMSKMWSTREVDEAQEIGSNPSELTFTECKTGNERPFYIAKRADGKIIKSPSYSPADIQKVIQNHGKNGK